MVETLIERLTKNCRERTDVLDRTKGGNIKELGTDKLFALQNPMLLDGRVSSYPGSARGYSVTNCYLLRQPDAAWLIDTGFGGD